MNAVAYLISFIVIYLMYLFFVILRRKSLEKFMGSTYVLYLKNVYKIEVEKCNPYPLANIVALANAFILSTSMVIVVNYGEGITKWIITFICVMVLLFGTYHIIGKILQKKGDKDV